MAALLDRSISGSNSNSGLYAKRRLANLDFGSFQRCVWLWLGASGYQHMRFCGRRTQRGRAASGPDFLVRIGPDGMDVAVQIRHWKSPVSKRAVDELRGVLLRDDIPAGMIVATSPCSRAARIAAADFQGRPIRIIGIDRLSESLHTLGLELDERFFRLIRQFTLGSAEAAPRARAARLVAVERAEPGFADPTPRFDLLVLAFALLAGLIVLGATVR